MDRLIGYHVVLTPSFLNQVRALPVAETDHVWAKVNLLYANPAPDAKNKKRLKGHKGNVCRIRSGKYRVLYTFDPQRGLVQLLAVDDRKDAYKNGQLITVDLDFSAEDLPGDALLEVVTRPPVAHAWPVAPVSVEPPVAPPQAPPEPLPKTLDETFLAHLRIEPSLHAALLPCRTIDDLIEAPVPEKVRGLVFDALLAPDLDRVLQQPTLILNEPEDLVRFYEGSLTYFLLQLDPEQQRFVDWAVNGSGPALVKGGPGTGKTIIALYRVRSLIKALRESGVAEPRILFTAYTNTLVESSRQLIGQLLGDDRGLVEICTADALVSNILLQAGTKPKTLLDDGQARASVYHARKRLSQGSHDENVMIELITALDLEFLREEIDEVIVARECSSIEDYLGVSRAGRGVRLTATQRRAIWCLHEEREKVTAEKDEMTFSQRRRRAVELVRHGQGPPPYDGVLVDEAQDLEPTVLRLLIALCKSKDRLFLTADPNQSIYGSGFRWADVHQDLQFRGRTGVLRKNYRTTRQIAVAAEAWLAGAELEAAEEPFECVREGPPPLLRHAASNDEQTDFIVQFLRASTRELRAGLGACAVLVPTQQAGFEIAKSLTKQGLEAKFMAQKQIDLDAPVVKVITMHSAKGLEFPIVAVAARAGFRPKPASPTASDDAIDEERRMRRRLLYVAMTRAIERLLVVAPESHSA